MLLTSWLSCVRTRWNRRNIRRGRREHLGNRATVARPRPAIECLEDRALLATFTVSFLGDELDGNTAAGDLSLREAIREANSTPGADEIVLPAGTFNLSLAGADEESAATGDLDITDDVSIVGAGTTSTTIHANGIDRVFHVHADVTASFTRVRITGGLAVQGGGLLIESDTDVTITSSRLDHNQAIGSEGTSGEGGAIFVNADFGFPSDSFLVVEDSDLDHNTAQGGLGRVSGSGGAIFNDSGNVEIHASRLSDNLAQSGAGENIGSGGAAKGGAISNRFGHIEIFGSELTDNVARGGAAGDGAAEGGAIHTTFFFGGGEVEGGGGIATTLIVVDSTLTGNKAEGTGNGDAEGGAIWAEFDHVEIIGSELSENEAIGGASGGAGRGGAIFANGTGGFAPSLQTGPIEFFDLYIVDSKLFDNVAQGGGSRVGGGGAVWAEFNQVGIFQSTLDGNIARGGSSGRGIGGGIYGKEVQRLEVIQSTLSDNIAQGGNESGSGDGWGGGVYVGFGSNLRLDNSTLSANQARAGVTGGDALGGGAYTAESRIELRNVTVTLNQSLATVGVGKGGGVASGDPDRDHDFVQNRFDNAPDVRNSDQRDDDFDGIANVLDPDIDGDTLLNGDDDDIDGDGVLNGADNSPNISNADQSDSDADGVGDVSDNAFSTSNPDQLDSNGDGLGDAAQQGDNDGDGVPDFQDNAPFSANAGQEDLDGDGVGDVAEELLVILANTVIAGNTADSAPDVSGHFFSFGGNFIGNGTGSFGFNPGFTNIPDQVGTGVSPLDPLLGPLAENGGSTRTHLPLVGSPLIDSGDEFQVSNSHFLDDGFGFLDRPDQRGFDRFVDGNDEDTNDEVDIGATEFGALPRPAIESESYDHALLQIVVEEVGTGVRHTLVLEGFTSHFTVFDVVNPLDLSQEGDADDTDQDGLDEVVTFLENAVFFGDSPLGSIYIEPDFDVENNGLGEIEETTQTNAGRLDLPPFGTGSANSFFDLSFFVYVDSTEYHHTTPMRLQGTVSLKPAGLGDTFQLLGAPVVLLDGDDHPAFTLIEVNYTPLPEANFDFGDAPDSFPTTYFEDGARHFLSPVGPIFGTVRDIESDGQSTPLADGDDLNSVESPDDEDGIDFITVIVAGENASIEVTVTALPGTDPDANFFVNAWLDFNGDGDWNDAFEHILDDQQVGSGTTEMSFPVPSDARGQDHATARFRVSTVQDLSFTGFAPDGEVEDHSVGVAIPPRDFGDALGDFYATTIDGPFSQFVFAASHGILDSDLETPGVQPSLFLGSGVDADLDGQPTATANGDDTDADGDDEDGVFQINAQGDPVPFGTIPLVFGQTGIAVQVIASGPGVLNGWVDFIGDGFFDNGTFLGEQIFDDVSLVTGVNNLTFDYPDNFTVRFLSADQTFARFRFSSVGGLNSFGAAADGEVEDYPVQLRSFDFGDAPDSYATRLDSDPGDGQPDATPGAQHVRRGPMLGFRRDADLDGQPSPPAGGDDFGFTDDEDGVRVTALVAGFQGDVTIFVSQLAEEQTAYVDGWIDYDNNGTFDPDEQILTDAAITAEFFGIGARTVSFVVPPDVVTGVTTFARFRVSASANGVTSPIGLAEDGEVEDYAYLIFEPDFPDEVEEDGTLVFVDVTPGPVARDPAIAQGYDYFTPDAGNFKSVELPAFGDNVYFLHLSDGAGGFLETPAARLVAGTSYDFTAGFLDADNVSFAAVPAGLDSFRILGIETTSEIDIADGLGFPTILDVTATTDINMLGIPEAVYVDQLADFINETNPGNTPVAGNLVTWIGSAGVADDVTGLVFGTSAFATVQSAIDHVEDNDFSQLTATTGTVIQIAPGTFTEHLTISGTTLVGAGAGQTILDGGGTGRVIDVLVGANVSISDVSIQNGAVTGDGGGLRNLGTLTITNSSISNNRTENGGNGSNASGGNGGHAGSGGGIFNAGTLTLTNSTVAGNSTGQGGLGGFGTNDAGEGGNGGNGGGVFNTGTLTIVSSTISANTTGNGGNGADSSGGVGIAGHGGHGGAGGGIHNTGTLSLSNSTISGNATGSGGSGGTGSGSHGSGGSGGDGGGLFNSLVLTADSNTITGNTVGNFGSGLVVNGSTGMGGGIHTQGDDSDDVLRNTIVAGNGIITIATPNDISGIVNTVLSFTNLIGNAASSGGLTNGDANDNIVGDTGAGTLDINTILNTTLANNGGSTATHALVTDSPAINAGSNALIPSGILFDQRGTGFDRINDLIVDIGAVESPALINFAATAVSLSPNPASIDENTDTTSRVKVADITITDDGLGTNSLTLSGTDAASFEIDGLELFVTAGVTLNFEFQTSYSVTIEVDDTAVGDTPDATVNFTLNVNDVNEAPSAVAATPNPASLAENTDTTSRVKVAGISVTDDALGTESFTLSGTDALSFEIIGTELFVKAGVTLNFEGQPSYSVTVEVDDTTIGSTPDAAQAFTLNVTDVNEVPTAVTLTPSSTAIDENAGTATRTKVSDISVTDDALGSEVLSLSGTDASSFEIIGTELFLRSGVTLDFETQPSYSVTVEADDSTVGSTPDATQSFTLNLNDVNEAPTAVALIPNPADLDENTDMTSRIKVADINVTDDALGTETFSLSGTDAGSFEIDGTELFLRAGVTLDFEVQTSYSVTVDADDTSVGGSPDVSQAFTFNVNDVNESPTLANAISDQFATEGVAFAFQFASNSFDDVDAGDSLTYSANRIGGGALPSWLTFNATTRTFSGTPANTDVGTLSVRVTARDSGNLTVTEDFDIAVIGVLVVNVGGTLTITDVGGASNDNVGLSLNAAGDALVVTLEGSTFEFPLAGLTNVVINGGSGNDTLNLDLSNGLLPFNIQFNGGTGGHDTLNLTGFDGSGLDAFTASFSNRNDGDIQLRNGDTVASTVTYTGLEPITIDGTPTEIIFNLPNTNDTDVRLLDIGGANGVMRLTGSTFETTDFSIGLATSITINANAGNDRVTIQSIDSGFHGTVIVQGGAGNDRLEATASTIGVDLRGDAGNDTLTGSPQNDTLSGGLGNDSLTGGAGFDTVADTAVNLTLKNTTLTGNGNDKLTSIERAHLTGTASNNVLDASAFTLGNVTLVGGAGNDLLIGSAFVGLVDADGFNDSLDGGEGTDVARQSSLANQTLSAGSAIDTTVATGAGSDLWTSIEGAHLIGAGSNAKMFNASAYAGGVTIEGGAGNDTLIGGSGNNVLNGNAGSDSMVGGATADTMFGGAGSDTLDGLSGSDQLRGQSGNDLLLGGSGDDRLFGEEGRDTIVGGDGQDVIDGGADNDLITGNSGHDLINGGSGNDAISGGDGDDTINGNSGSDTLIGGTGADVLRSGSGTDRIIGGNGNDRIEASGAVIATGDGDDTVIGTSNSINEAFTFDFDRLLAGIN